MNVLIFRLSRLLQVFLFVVLCTSGLTAQASEPCSRGLTLGDTCSDGSIVAGEVNGKRLAVNPRECRPGDNGTQLCGVSPQDYTHVRFERAREYCSSIKIGENSCSNWRLPTKEEWSEILSKQNSLPAAAQTGVVNWIDNGVSSYFETVMSLSGETRDYRPGADGRGRAIPRCVREVGTNTAPTCDGENGDARWNALPLCSELNSRSRNRLSVGFECKSVTKETTLFHRSGPVRWKLVSNSDNRRIWAIDISNSGLLRSYPIRMGASDQIEDLKPVYRNSIGRDFESPVKVIDGSPYIFVSELGEAVPYQTAREHCAASVQVSLGDSEAEIQMGLPYPGHAFNYARGERKNADTLNPVSLQYLDHLNFIEALGLTETKRVWGGHSGGLRGLAPIVRPIYGRATSGVVYEMSKSANFVCVGI